MPQAFQRFLRHSFSFGIVRICGQPAAQHCLGQQGVHIPLHGDPLVREYVPGTAKLGRNSVDAVAGEDGTDLIRILIFKVRLLADYFPDHFLLKTGKIFKSVSCDPVIGNKIKCAGWPARGLFPDFPPAPWSHHISPGNIPDLHKQHSSLTRHYTQCNSLVFHILGYILFQNHS